MPRGLAIFDFDCTLTKFHVWGLTSMRKVIFLDADTLPLHEIDSLAEHPSDFAAAPDAKHGPTGNQQWQLLELKSGGVNIVTG